MQAQHSGKSGMICDERIFWRNFKEKTMDKIVALAKSRGFIYPGSEIYGWTCKHMGLRKSGRRVEEQCKESMMAEVYSGE